MKLRLVICLCAGLLVACHQEKTTTNSAPALPIPTDFVEELWYKNSLIYNLDVEVFKDSDNDGIGDFKGLTQQLDYLKTFGVDAIWLAPFQPTPNKDDGYDVADFYTIDSRLGTATDFDEFIRQAGQRNIRVMMDLVVNHTSDQHPWFQQARRQKNSPYRSWYVWSKERPSDYDKGMVFPGVQKEIWSYDSLAGEYFYHRFYRNQPDLNVQNPAVQTEIRKIVRHWLDKGISGFRMDGVPFFIEVTKPGEQEPQQQFDLLTQIHQLIQWRKSDAIMLGETNVEPKENKKYFGENGEGMQMMFNFFVNQHLFHSLATEEVKPLADALNATREIPATSQWAQFLRNHDEIDLGRLSDKQREEIFKQFGPDTNMQLYDRGLRRRLAPMLGDRPQIELAYSLLFSLPGTPVIRYGEEIGMGDDLKLPERYSIRTPMQWSGDRNGGFSNADKTVRPVIAEGDYSYTKVNVEAQRRDSTSLLNRITRFIQLRKKYPEIGYGNWTLVDTGSPNVLAIQYDWRNRSLLMVHNFTKEAKQLKLDAKLPAGSSLQSLLDQRQVQAANSGKIPVQLTGYGYNWYEIRKGASGQSTSIAKNK